MTVFCRANEPFLANLKALLDEAERQGVSQFDAVVSAQAVYDDINGYLAFIPYFGLGTDVCSQSVVELKQAADRVTIVLNAIPGANTSIPRPDAPLPDPNSSGIPMWVKGAVFAGLAIAGLHYVSPLIKGFAPRRRLAGRNRSRR